MNKLCAKSPSLLGWPSLIHSEPWSTYWFSMICFLGMAMSDMERKKMFEDAKMSFHTFPAEMIWSWCRPSTSVPELDKHSIERWFTHSEWLCFSRNSVKLPEGSMHVKLNTLWTWYIYVYINTCISIHTRRASVCVCACGCLMVCHFMCFMEFLPITYNTSSSQQ